MARDKLLDTLDFIEEIKSIGAKVDENGYVTVDQQISGENEKKKNGNAPLTNTNSEYQLSGVLPSDINISDLVKNINILIH